MTADDAVPATENWVDRAAAMVGYIDAARDFVRRAAQHVQAVDADIEVVCYLWALADEHDVLVCNALTRFDERLFDSTGDLDITRGVEEAPQADEPPELSYTCSWALHRPDSAKVSVVMSISQNGTDPRLHVANSIGRVRTISLPIQDPTSLYEAIGRACFEIAALSSSPTLQPDETDS